MEVPASRLVCLLVCSLLAGCASGLTPRMGDAVIEVAVLTPPEGAKLDSSSIVSAVINYDVSDFRPGQYFLAAQFRKNAPGASGQEFRTFDGEFPTSNYPVLATASGSIRFDFPMQYVIDHPELGEEIEMWFFLNYRTTALQSVVIGTAGPFKFERK